MTQENSPQGAGTPAGAGEDNASPRPDDTTPLGALVAQLLARVDSLEREVKRLKRPEPDWSQHVLKESERWCEL